MTEHNREPIQRLTIEAEIVTPLGHALAVRLDHPQPGRHQFSRERSYWIDLCLTPRRARASGRYCDVWGPGRRQPLGVLIAIPPRRRVELESAGGAHHSLICELKAEAVERWLPEDFVWTDRRLELCLNLPSPSIRTQLLRLNREVRDPGLGAEAFCEALMAELAIELARELCQTNEPETHGGLAPWRSRLIDERLARAGPGPSVAELAQACQLSPRQLRRAFRVSRGCALRDYLIAARAEAMKRAILAPEPVAAVAKSLGFASASSFIAAFRKATGTTPARYRQDRNPPPA